MQALVRNTAPSDREGILHILLKTGNLTGEEKDCAAELLDIYFTDPAQRDYLFMTALDGSHRPVGYICYGKTPLTSAAYDIYWIVVDSARRNMGVGRMLLEKAEERIKKEGATLVAAETSSLPSYEAARGFYERNGFREEARISGFYKPGDDKIIFVKRF
ncbi:MAG: GNAT family N-acetyltransferase [Deltaproteobacteria bacterium]|nr:GNAT family N-acetyltransferase [Deltaproteobacteria bacterium]